jgi:hypothetical protein
VGNFLLVIFELALGVWLIISNFDSSLLESGLNWSRILHVDSTNKQSIDDSPEDGEAGTGDNERWCQCASKVLCSSVGSHAISNDEFVCII